MAILSLNEVLNCGDNTQNSRNLIGAERVLAAKLIITYRVTKKPEKN